jgi:hypothetical protein
MFRKFRLLVLPAAFALAACSSESTGDAKEVADLRTQLQRSQQMAEKQREQIATLERRIAGLAEDVARVHAASAAVAAAPAAKPDGAATDAGGDAPGAAAASTATIANAPAMKAYFESEEGKKTVAAALKAAQDQAEQERTSRTVDNLLARIGKDANLTEDQSKKMKDILNRGAAHLREIVQQMRDGPGGADMGDVRQKFTDLRTSVDNEVKVVLSQTQFDTYQKTIQQSGVLGGFGGGGPGGFGRPRGTPAGGN